MAINNVPPELVLPDIRKPARTRPLWWLFGWGGVASIALAAAAFTSQSEDGSKRLQLALAFASEPAPVVAQIPARDLDAEIRRLAAQLHEFAAERERLTARIATLERNIEDMTGSIRQQSEQLAAARAAASAPPLVPSVPDTAPAVTAAPPPAAILPALTPLAMPAIDEAAASWPEAPKTTETEQPAAQPKAAEVATEAVPVRVANAPASEPAAAEPPPANAGYGIDLGGASSLEALRIHWAALKASYGPLLVGLHPLATQVPKRPTGLMYRLIVGPLPNADEAARLCARFPVLRTGCHPAKFTGAQLAAH